MTHCGSRCCSRPSVRRHSNAQSGAGHSSTTIFNSDLENTTPAHLLESSILGKSQASEKEHVDRPRIKQPPSRRPPPARWRSARPASIISAHQSKPLSSSTPFCARRNPFALSSCRPRQGHAPASPSDAVMRAPLPIRALGPGARRYASQAQPPVPHPFHIALLHFGSPISGAFQCGCAGGFGWRCRGQTACANGPKWFVAIAIMAQRQLITVCHKAIFMENNKAMQ
jgi:hypothetical protein